MNDNPAGAIIRLTRDEAVVLFELLSRWESDEEKDYPPDNCFEAAGETSALLQILAQLESQLAEPFRSDYGEILKAARQRLSHGQEDFGLRR
jgi:hypothetical protein